MEESKDLQSLYKVFRTFIYASVILEFFEYAIDPNMLDFWGGVLVDIHDRIKLMDVYQDGHMLHSKIMTLLIICVTCIGTRNKKHLEFNAKTMVIYPISAGIILMFLSVWVFKQHWPPHIFTLYSSTWLYFVMSIVGTVLCHVAQNFLFCSVLGKITTMHDDISSWQVNQLLMSVVGVRDLKDF
jgi:membrane-associated HD superfamily phosphohydrolase